MEYGLSLAQQVKTPVARLPDIRLFTSHCHFLPPRLLLSQHSSESSLATIHLHFHIVHLVSYYISP